MIDGEVFLQGHNVPNSRSKKGSIPLLIIGVGHLRHREQLKPTKGERWCQIKEEIHSEMNLKFEKAK